MAMQDCTKFLGKHVAYSYEFHPDFPIQHKTGVIVAVMKSAVGYENMVGNDVLFLEDGESDLDFISGEHQFKLLEN